MTPAVAREFSKFRAAQHRWIFAGGSCLVSSTCYWASLFCCCQPAGYGGDWVAAHWLNAQGLDLPSVSACIVLMTALGGIRLFSGLYQGGRCCTGRAIVIQWAIRRFCNATIGRCGVIPSLCLRDSGCILLLVTAGRRRFSCWLTVTSCIEHSSGRGTSRGLPICRRCVRSAGLPVGWRSSRLCGFQYRRSTVCCCRAT